MARRGTSLVLLVAFAAIGLGVLAKSWCGVPSGPEADYLGWCYSDVPPLYFTERLDAGATPYVDHPVEYPVLTGAVMWLAASVTSDLAGYVWVTYALLAAAGVGVAWLLAREVGWPRALAYAAAPTLAVSAVVNWDLPAVLLATAGIVAHRRGRDLGSGVALGLGTAAKLFPALFVLPLVLAAGRLRGTRAAMATAGGAAAAWLAVNLPVLLVTPSRGAPYLAWSEQRFDNWSRFFELSRERPSDWDALSTIVLDAAGWDVAVGTLNTVLLVIFAAGYLAVLAYAVRRDPAHTWHLAALPLLALFLLGSKVYSPQFSLWLLPLFAFSFPGWLPWLAFGVADVAVTLTRFRYLANFVGDDGLDGAWPQGPFTAALVVRAAVLAWAAWWGWRRAVGRQRDRDPAASPATDRPPGLEAAPA